MKKLLFGLLTFGVFTTYAQEAPKVTSAIIALRGNEIEEAKGFIDEAAAIIETKNQSEIKEKILTKYYYNKALIYAKIAGSPEGNIKALSDNANEIAAESILDLLKYESTLKKPRYSENALREVPMIAYNYLVDAGASYDAKDYAASYNKYMAAFDFKKNELLGNVAQLDTSLLFNAGIIAGMSDDQESSINAFRTCLDLGYTGITYTATYIASGQPKTYPDKRAMEKDIELGLASNPIIGEDVRPGIYISLINAYKKIEDAEMYQSTLVEARSLYPENKDLLDIQLQAYLDKKDYKGALANLDEAILKNPDKAIYHFVKGNILQTELKDLDAALVEYKSAVELDPENSDALYMCGLVYIDRANKITEQMNSLSLSESRKYEALKKKQKGVFEESLVYFKNAREINKDDLDIVRALAEVYRKVGEYDKSMEMSELLK